LLKLPIDNIYSILINLYTPNVRAFYSLTILTDNNLFHPNKSKSPIYLLTLHNSNYIYLIDITTCSILAITQFSIDSHLVTLQLNELIEGVNPSLTLMFLQLSNFTFQQCDTYDIIKSSNIFIPDSLIEDIKLLLK
jgi:hypothetical protein